MSESDVARVKELIALECQALKRVFDEPSSVASHDVINARFKNIDGHRDTLVQKVGEEKANEEVVNIYQRIVR